MRTDIVLELVVMRKSEADELERQAKRADALETLVHELLRSARGYRSALLRCAGVLRAMYKKARWASKELDYWRGIAQARNLSLISAEREIARLRQPDDPLFPKGLVRASIPYQQRAVAAEDEARSLRAKLERASGLIGDQATKLAALHTAIETKRQELEQAKDEIGSLHEEVETWKESAIARAGELDVAHVNLEQARTAALIAEGDLRTLRARITQETAARELQAKDWGIGLEAGTVSYLRPKL